MPYTPIPVNNVAPNIVAGYSPRRESLLIQYQTGAGNLFISQDQANPTAAGIKVTPGGTVIFRKIDGDPVEQAYYGLLDAGTGNVLIYEGVPEQPGK